MKQVRDSIDSLDANRKHVIAHNVDMRMKYKNLLKDELSRSDHSLDGIKSQNQIHLIIEIIKRNSTCDTFCNQMSKNIFICVGGCIYIVCEECTEKSGKWPYCDVQDLTRNRFIERIFSAVNEVRKGRK